MAESTLATRRSQWRKFVQFCVVYDRIALPASLETILLYLAFLAEKFKYVSIINYLSAVWVFHKVNGYEHVDPKSFPIVITLRGIRRTLGDVSIQARPVSVTELKMIFSVLDMSVDEDLALWVAILLCFRGSLRKSNVVEEGLAVEVNDVVVFPWGLLLSVRRTKTISFRERVLTIPFTYLHGSCFCVCHYVKLLLQRGRISNRPHQLVAYVKGDKWVRGSYSWLSKRVKMVCNVLQLQELTTHSFRRGAATALAEVGVALSDIRDLGDWRSMSVLLYLKRDLMSKVRLDQEIVGKLFS